MTQQDVLDYIRKTPHNSNVNVMKSMLDSLGGSSLPEVTNEDNGKVLTVVEGEWDKAAGGGAEPLIVTLHADLMPDTGTRYTMDKTWQEIYDAFPNACVVEEEYTKDKVNRIYADDAHFYVDVGGPSPEIVAAFHTDSADGYPFMEVI